MSRRAHVTCEKKGLKDSVWFANFLLHGMVTNDTPDPKVLLDGAPEQNTATVTNRPLCFKPIKFWGCLLLGHN